MAILDPLVLSGDVILIPVETLPAYMHEQMQHAPGDVVITRPRSRTTSRIVDAQTAELLKLFSSPITVVQAVIHFSRLHQLNPEQVLTDAFPILQSFMDISFLVTADAEQTQQIIPSRSVGARFAHYTILSCIHIVEDTEVYQATHPNGETVALKISRPGCSRATLSMFEQEVTILHHLDNTVNPALLDAGVFEDQHYVVTEWCSGVNVSVMIEELHRQRQTDNHIQLLRLCISILDVYAHLHAQNILHGDIHPGNILVTSDGSIKIIDYGFACQADNTPAETTQPRADIHYFSEPEYAQAILADLYTPRISLQGEQFSLAALLYFLLTGAHYLKFSLEHTEVLQQITTGHPLPFSAWDVQPWFEVETLLATALDKDPAHRFPSVAEFAHRLQEVADLDNQPGPTPTQQRSTTSPTQTLLQNVLQHLGQDGPLLATGLTAAPTCSLTVGAAGIAYALYRIACIQDDPALLSLADIWSMQAVNAIKSTNAFYSETDLTPDIIGQVSPYYTASGVYCVQAFISHARGDFSSQQEAMDAFIAASQAPCTSIDLVLGRSGTLLASSFLLDKALQTKRVHTESLLTQGNALMHSIWDEIKTFPAIPECTAIAHLGMAHGWTGLLYATLCWCQSVNSEYPDGIEERLQQLATCGERYGNGMRWRRVLPHSDQGHTNLYMPNWCNGSAGYIYLWTLAQRLFGNAMYARLAEQAAWNTWETRNTLGILCCGLAGQAYGLLNLYKHTGEKIWLTRAQTLADHATHTAKDFIPTSGTLYTSSELRCESLYYGDTGIAVLAADLARPEEAAMPFFEREY